MIHIASGKKIISFDPATDSREDILAQATGRTGNLRAPTLRKGDQFYVGFNDELYRQLVE